MTFVWYNNQYTNKHQEFTFDENTIELYRNLLTLEEKNFR